MIHVLYVDDEPDLLVLGKIFLEKPGAMTVGTATSARQALEMLEQYPYDAVVSDFQMPEMNGISFLKHIRTDFGNLPFILFTGKGREEVVIDALNNGADFYLQKGGDPKSQFIELHHKIIQAVRHRESEEKILFYNRIYAILSGVNAAILRIPSRNELLREICSIIVEQGMFSKAWIGMIDTGKDLLSPVASCGYENTPLSPVRLSGGNNSSGERASVSAVTEKKRVIQNDIHQEGAALQPPGLPGTREYHSTAAFPLWLHNDVIGTLQMYAFEPHFFGETEVRMLDKVCSDISYALERIASDEQKKKAEQALLESEEKFRILVEESLVGVYIIRGDRFLHVNPRFAEVIGYSRDEIINNLRVQDIVSPESREMVAGNLRMRLSGDIKSLHYTLKCRRKDGKDIEVEVAGTRTLYQGQPIVIGTVMNINERRNADNNLIQANRKLTLMQDMTRHDIANRLTALRGRLRMIRKQYNDPALLQQLKKVDDAGRDIFTSLETARVYQKIGIHAPCWQNIQEMITRELNLVDTPSLNVTLMVTGLEIYADPLCNRIFANLVDNTVRHGDHATEIRVSFQKSHEGVIIIWEDNGIGIPSDLKERVFEQGFGSNTGLGLFLCREIFLNTGITMRETGVPGNGVRFEITVPGSACRISGEKPVMTGDHQPERSNTRS
ncbi:MAG: response regulator [Methanoregula sp.]|nr:response regulator [Methanoregula sp.]